MKLNSEPLKNWFGFTRRERRSASILLTLIIFIIGLRYLVPERNIEIETYGIFLADTENSIVISDAEKETQSYKNYSSGGGKFRNPSAVQQKTPIDINGCDSTALVALPGIGPVLSARIIKYRKLLGGFASVEQLKEVYGLPEETYEMIKGRLYADSSGLRKINVNSADFRELSHIHYLEKYDISAILKYRELTGRINSIEDLKENKILTPETAEKVEPYMDFR